MTSNANTGTAYRLQQLIPASLILALTLTVVWLSYTQEPSDAFLFPRLISSVMLVLASWNFIRAAAGLARVGSGLSALTIRAITPGVMIMLVFVFIAAKALGFYTASFVAFFCLFSVYDPNSHRRIRSWLWRAFITAAFMAVIYGLFTLLLKVQTPRGLFI